MAAGRRTAEPFSVRVGVGTANGSFGELLQGARTGPDQVIGEDRFLVTLPVARWSMARFELRPPGSGFQVHPAGKTKAAAFVQTLLAELGVPGGGVLQLRSTLPEGKGLASSSADLVATARAVTAAVQRRISLDRLAALLAAIEPTDGVLRPGIVVFDHRRGRYLGTLGALPALRVLAVDQGGVVDSVAYNHLVAGYDEAERAEYDVLLARLGDAVARHDLTAVGAIATRSAELNQTRLPNHNFAALKAICRQVGGLGLVACHSGTMLGLLLDPADPAYRHRLYDAVRMTEELPGRSHLYPTLAPSGTLDCAVSHRTGRDGLLATSHTNLR